MTRAGLVLSGLSVGYPVGRAGTARAVDEVDLAIAPGEIVGLVGESGCGKSSLARAVVGLEASTGQIRLDGADLPVRRRGEHARAIQMVFQDPYASLNPRMTVRAALEEMVRVHGLRPRSAVPARARELATLVGLPDRALEARPAELSGGQRQRVAIARALALEPRMLLADEPTTALDVSVQAVILQLFDSLRRELDLGILLITHNLGVVSAVCDRVAVMYLGRIVEQGATATLLTGPRHPYTRQLVAAVPRLKEVARAPVELLAGDPPSMLRRPAGCAFHPRCPERGDPCDRLRPELVGNPVGNNGTVDWVHVVACHFAWPTVHAGNEPPITRG